MVWSLSAETRSVFATVFGGRLPIKKKQQDVVGFLEALKIEYTQLDIASNEENRMWMRENDYETFFDAKEDNQVYAFLGLPPPPGSKEALQAEQSLILQNGAHPDEDLEEAPQENSTEECNGHVDSDEVAEELAKLTGEEGAEEVEEEAGEEGGEEAAGEVGEEEEAEEEEAEAREEEQEEEEEEAGEEEEAEEGTEDAEEDTVILTHGFVCNPSLCVHLHPILHPFNKKVAREEEDKDEEEEGEEEEEEEAKLPIAWPYHCLWEGHGRGSEVRKKSCDSLRSQRNTRVRQRKKPLQTRMKKMSSLNLVVVRISVSTNTFKLGEPPPSPPPPPPR
ncbi:hypothetical protein JZ751_002254 [Albula glossodonta]|uniref:SH3 domain-binding glutamic acid-rich protein n=1 Tax=Albula glossodonta TaxID=121402 RepID=A0A8T2PGA4_9TELE|nr:hypothetical protein JZ751_002254 [Albula glossodonta]